MRGLLRLAVLAGLLVVVAYVGLRLADAFVRVYVGPLVGWASVAPPVIVAAGLVVLGVLMATDPHGPRGR